MSKTRKIGRKIICFLLMISLLTPVSLMFEGTTKVEGAKSWLKIEVEDRDKTDDKVKFVVTTSDDIAELDINYFEYTSMDDDWGYPDPPKFKEVSDNCFEATYNIENEKYGTYDLGIDGVNEYGEYADAHDEVSFEYVPEIQEMSIENPGGSIYVDGIGSFNHYYEIDGWNDADIYVKPGEDIHLRVLYKRQTAKHVKASSLYLKWGDRTIFPTDIGHYDVSEYYTGAQYDIDTSYSGSGSLVAYYINEDGKTGSKSLGVRLYSDGTNPSIEIDNRFVGEKTKYFNEKISVPITINESNFDAGNTTVTVNGRAVNVSWSGSGSSHRGNVSLDEGTHEITVVSTDKSGNRSNEVKSSKIIIDKDEPKVKITGFENGTGKGLIDGKEVALPLKVTISDETKLEKNKVELFRVSEDEESKIKVGLQKKSSGNKVEFYIDDLKEDGHYILEAYAEDAAGNKATSKSVKSEGKKAYKVSNGNISGNFTVNRKGSLYRAEDESVFSKPMKEVNDIVIYEYNKNKIEGHTVTIIDSISSKELTENDYKFEKLKNSDNAEYKYAYKYTIYSKNFVEGIYNIEINSESIAGQNGVLIARTVESNSLNKQIIIDKTSPEVVMFEGTTTGQLEVRVRDNYMDISSAKILVGNREYKLTYDEKNSTSTNIVFTGDIGINPEKAKFVCKDIAGNETSSEAITIIESSMVMTIVIVILLAVVGIALIIGTIIIVVSIRKKK